MVSPRYALLVLVAALAACDGGRDKGVETDAAAPATSATSATDDPPGAQVSASEFLSTLSLPFPHEVTNSRAVTQKGGGTAQVFSIDYTEGKVRAIDKQLSVALSKVGMERGALTTVPGGVRVAYSAPDGRKVSTLIRNKKYFKDRIAANSAGQVSLTYVPR